MTLKPLLDVIAKHESGGDYNIVWGGIRKEDQPPKPLVEMTVKEVLDWQDSIDRKYMSEASGRYQIMEDTLRDIVRYVGHHALFNEDTQDKLAVKLMERRGLNKYISGEITAEQFANNLAKEWASLPVVTGPKKGSSYYAGDGLNKAHASVSEVMDAVKAIKGKKPSKLGNLIKKLKQTCKK